MSFSLSFKTWLVKNASNEKLMVRYSDTGDQMLLARLYDECGNDLYHFLLTLSDATLAKDISQKTWLKVMEKKHLYQGNGLFKAWLFTLARNLLIDDYRLIKPSSAELDGISANEISLQPDDPFLSRFNQALSQLPFVQREAFCLQQEGFALKEIAHITHAPIETTKSRLRYAKEALRESLKDIIEEDHV